ncbi:PIG-L family deacetylase [Gephyromycinifex aptenodytis]|uniref:PIG-L family deacetylase n=1 Tax=Gephyromycinifex aptenodytis TaxID=2716227 RepID=UPI001445C760|nr:PIG-L family deacetylase [Gephyromycinifex aptenodytis]
MWARTREQARASTLADLSGAASGTLLVISAHPDDETLGAGRLISQWARDIGPVHALCLTRGEACLDHLGITIEGIGERRELEWHAALEHLHVQAGHVADVPDGLVRDHHARARELIGEYAKDAAAILAPWRADPHPDHMAAGRAAAWIAYELGIPLIEYPVWLTFWGACSSFERSGAQLHRVHTDDTAEADRAAALGCFQSQLEPLHSNVTAILPPAFHEHHNEQLAITMDIPVLHAAGASWSDGLLALHPVPPPFDLPQDYPRHDPDPAQTADAMRHLDASLPWAELDWPHLVTGLIALGRTDIPLARLVEGHIDALRILAQAGAQPPVAALYGVWASRSHATGLRATSADNGWQIEGTLRFASGAGVLDRALVPVWTGAETHVLLDLAVAAWPVDTSQWRTSAMAVSRSHTIELEGLHAAESARIGADNWYLQRPGFFPGGVGVAAVWAGGGARILDLVHEAVASAPPAPSRALRLGHMRTELAAAMSLVRLGADQLEALLSSEDSDIDDAAISHLRDVCTEVRAGVAAAVLRLCEHARRIVGPAGLAYDEDLTRGLHDLELYVRQQNADADATYLGR